MSETNDDVVITDAMVDSGDRASFGVRSNWDRADGLRRIYRAMAKVDPARQSSFTPTGDDIYSLATALYANAFDIRFADAKSVLTASDTTTRTRDHWLNLARIAFEHPGYLPSIKAARQDAMSAYKYERDNDREEIAAWKGRCDVLTEQLRSALSQYPHVENGVCTLHGSISVMGKCPLCADDVKFKAELKLDTAPEHLTLDQQYRLVEVAFITDNQQIRRAALDVLMRAFNPGIVVP